MRGMRGLLTKRQRLTPAQKREIEFILQLKAEQPSYASPQRAAGGAEYNIRILSRGEQAFYQEGSRALLLEISAGYGVIMKSSIRFWDDGQKVTEEERARVIERMGSYLTASGDPATFKVL